MSQTGQKTAQLKKTAKASTRAKLRVLDKASARPAYREWRDEDLMLEQGRGSEAAFEELMRRYEKKMLNYMFRMVQNRQIAEELTQEVFMALVKNGQRYEPLAKFTTYLYAIASNIVTKEWARRKRRPRFISLFANLMNKDDDSFSPSDYLSDDSVDTVRSLKREEISHAINEALRHLPEHQRETFVLFRFQELSYEEVAEILNVPVGTAKSRIVRTERALRPYLERYRDYLGGDDLSN